MKAHTYKFILMLLVIGLIACENALEEEVFSELSPTNLFTSEKGLRSILNASYAYAHRSGNNEVRSLYFLASMTTGETWGAGGSIESRFRSMIDYTWDANLSEIQAPWVVFFKSIRDANIVLDNLDNTTFSAEFKQLTEAEVHFLRGWDYSELYNLYGSVPIYISPTDDPIQARASDSEIRAFIEKELSSAVATLPVKAPQYGRASKGAAMGVLCKYYLNTKQWQNAADLSKQIIDLGVYELVSDYEQVFSISNEGNQEILWALTKDGSSAPQDMNALIFPPDYPTPYPNNSVFAARTYLFDDFVNSFDPYDTRKNLIITQYVSNATGKLVQGLGANMSFPYKIQFDPGSVGTSAGNDIPIIRYADILLSRAEALNEISGPTQEAINLINRVRTRAGISSLNLSGFTKDSLREAILKEREWELWFEGKAREDQIRHGVMISRAQARGTGAQDFRTLFPIPQVEIDASPILEQNPGY